MPSDPLIKNPIYLDPDYIPEKLQFREEQIEALRDRYITVYNHAYNSKSGYDIPTESAGSPTNDAILLGSSGTGKTAIIKYSIGKIRDLMSRSPANMKIAYISGMQLEKERTFWTKLCTELNIYFSVAWSNDRLIEEIEEKARKTNIIVFLDELDAFLESYESKKQISERPLYYLSRVPTITVIAALNKFGTYKSMLPEKVQSSWSPEEINCPRYDRDALRAICDDRVIHGLNPHTINKDLIEIIVDQAYRSGGDARKLIRVLRMSVDHARTRNAKKIVQSDVEYATEQLDDLVSIKNITERAHDTHAVLIVLATSNSSSGMKSMDIIGKYEKMMKSLGETPLKYRTVMDILGDLRNEGLVKMDRARLRGNVYHYSFNENYMVSSNLLNHLARACPACKQNIQKLKIRLD